MQYSIGPSGVFYSYHDNRDFYELQEYRAIKTIYRPILTRARSYHRKMLLSISGWIARAGKRLKDVK